MRVFFIFIAIAACTTHPAVAEIPVGKDGFDAEVAPFFEANCVRCHGPEKSKGKITVHTLNGDLSEGQELERWEHILEMLESGEMPPEDEEQPADVDREKIAQWIEAGLRDYVSTASEEVAAPTARRLTNFEYENTIRDLLGFELKVIDDLSNDPVKPYKFNNSAELMRIGPEQIDRYLEVARRAMASAIVDPEKPEVHTTRRDWTSSGSERGLGGDEVGIWGNRRHTPAEGMGLKTFPRTGEYRIRIKASAILPPGITELPLRLVMGYGLNENQSTFQIETVGTMKLRNSPDNPEVYEFRGRMENHPARPGKLSKGVQQPDTMAITPQNLYDDGTLNDANDFSRSRNVAMPRAVVEWLEFESPLVDVWPPEHHTRILFDSPLRASDPKAYVAEVLNRFMSRAYRRPARDEEVKRFAKIYELVLPDLVTMEAAMRETLAMVLVSPEFLYHTEVENGATEQYELASRLSYFLWGSMPDEALMNLAAEGSLNESAAIEKQVRRLLEDDRSSDFIENFTTQWLSLEKSKTVPINRDLFPRFLYYVPRGERAGSEEPYRPTIRDYMMDETIGFVAEVIKRNAPVDTFVDSEFAFLNQPLAVHYGVDGVVGNELRPVAIKPDHHLGGLLTQGSVLIGNGTGSAPHPIYRAVWLREAVLGDEVKPPPADVPALSDTAGESAENALSIKDLLAQHRNKESCADCHVRLDPWGIPFEEYNAVGKFQPMVPKEGTRVSGFNPATHVNMTGYLEYLQTISSEAVDAKARLPHGPEVEGMADLKGHLLKDRKNDIAENVVRRLLTYSIGRELTYRDRYAVEQLLDQAKKNDFKVQDMIVSICQSPTFRSSGTKKNLQ